MIAAEQAVNTTLTLEQAAGTLVQRTVLPGGARVVTETMPGVRSASIGIWLNVGSVDEQRHEAGASHYLEHLLFKGTKNRTATQISAAIENVGGDINAFTGKEYTCFHASVLDEDVPIAIEVLVDLVTSALVAPDDVEGERGVILEEIAMRDDDPSDAVHEEFSFALFGTRDGLPGQLGRPILGTVASIEAMSPQVIADYYHRNYTSERFVITVAGNVDHANVVELARKTLEQAGFSSGDATPARPRLTDSQPPIATSSDVSGEAFAITPSPYRLATRPIEQANVLIGTPGLTRTDPRRFALSVFDAALGSGMSSRLFDIIRRQRALAYSVYSYAAQYANTGTFGCYAGCLPHKTGEVVDLLRQELAKVAAEGLTPEEVAHGIGQARGSLVLSLEDPSSRMMRLGRQELFNEQWRSLDEVLATLAAITPAEVNTLIADLLAHPLTLAVVGPFDPGTTF